ncbi:hypothetical protein NP233_g3370 [Leucocoprinus birnbaumii]|uniref:RNase H type-1 domain-containing protein n=1 Tax=Leucocoprinus birnbaumii TaxID=56174 RepID=A0AAD5VZA5_9AGAR|nr:hypothetical protein NP233_g3370 [Leucocoprinus birnbaumii]
MKTRKVPMAYVNFVRSLLEDRETCLRFDDFTSEPIRIDNGIGQGDPLSMLVYLIYNADLVEVPKTGPTEEAMGYVDDACFIAFGKRREDTIEILRDMMERDGGGFDWGRDHNSKFAIDKLAVTHFERRRPKGGGEEEPNREEEGKAKLVLRGQEVEEVDIYKYLGVYIDKELNWKVQEERALAKATKWVLMFKRLAKPSKGISQKLMRQLYLGVAIPKLTYALDIWYEPPILREGAKKKTGSVRALKMMSKVQRIAALAITGGLKSTPNDILDAHAGLTPLHLLLDKICYRNMVRICTLPPNNPLTRVARRCAAEQPNSPRRHLTNLHILIQRYNLFPSTIETIRPPSFTSADPLPMTTEVADSREESMQHERDDTSKYKIYSDGSNQNGRVGAAAVLVVEGNTDEARVLKYHLGSAKEHTSYEAEAVGAVLAMKLAREAVAGAERGEEGEVKISHYVDSQSVVKALKSRKGKTGQYLVESYRRGMAKIVEGSGAELRLNWISAHSGVEGNEMADEAAKQAAEGESSQRQDLPAIIRNPLRSSKSALRQAKTEETKRSWKEEWQKSPRFERMNSVDPNHPYNRFREWRDDLDRNQGSILVQLRSGHLPINVYLKRIGKRQDDKCDWCQENLGREIPETVNHFVLDCPAYANERHILARRIGRDNMCELQRIMTTEEGTRELLNFLDATRRFRNTLGRVHIKDYQKKEDAKEQNGV